MAFWNNTENTAEEKGGGGRGGLGGPEIKWARVLPIREREGVREGGREPLELLKWRVLTTWVVT